MDALLKEMQEYLIIKMVADIADNKSGKEKCTCKDTVLKDGFLCYFCKANELIGRLKLQDGQNAKAF